MTVSPYIAPTVSFVEYADNGAIIRYGSMALGFVTSRLIEAAGLVLDDGAVKLGLHRRRQRRRGAGQAQVQQQGGEGDPLHQPTIAPRPRRCTRAWSNPDMADRPTISLKTGKPARDPRRPRVRGGPPPKAEAALAAAPDRTPPPQRPG